MADHHNVSDASHGRNEMAFIHLCVEGNLFSKGIFSGGNPLESVIAISMLQIIASSAVSWTIYFILRPFGMPRFISSCLGGIVLGQSVLGQVPGFMETFYPSKDMPVFSTMATFSVVYYVFLLAVKMDPIAIIGTARYAWSIGLSTFLMPFFIISCLYFLVQDILPGLNNGTMPFMTFAMMTASSLSDTVNAMNELNLLNSELGQVATSSAALNEVVMWSLSFVSKRSGSIRPLRTMVSFCAFGIFLSCVMRPIILWIIRKIPEGKQVNEGVIITLLLGCATSGFVTDMLGMSFFPGVLLMGLVLPEGPPLGSALIERSEFLVNEFFLHFLFLGIGRVTDVSQIRDWKAFAAITLILIASYVGKFMAVCVGSFHLQMRSSSVFILGLMLNMKGPIVLIFLTRQLTDKYIDSQLYAVLVLSNILITAVAAGLLQNLYNPSARLEAVSSFNLTLRSLLTQSIGEFRILCCIHNEDDVQGMISLLEATSPTERNPMCAYVTHASELVGRVTPLLAPYKHHKKFSRHNSMNRILRAFINYAKTSPKSVTVQPFSLISPYRSMHESICRQAQENLIPLILLPFHGNQDVGTRGSIRGVNNNIQYYAPCTIGVLVRRKNFSHRLTCNVSLSHFSYNVALIFFGGDDDREALALADRMLGHPCVSMTVLRVIYAETDEERIQAESNLDDYLFKQFKEKYSGNACVVCNQVVVKNPVEVINAVNMLTDPYDLVIVGKRPCTSASFEEEAGNWTEYPELGVIGDMVASSDFCGEAVSVLVLQHPSKEDGNGAYGEQTISSAV